MIIQNLNKKFGDKSIFDNNSFAFEDGRVTYILGESGIGKTTLLRIIAGLDKDYTGKIIGKQEKVSYVFQEPRLFPNLNVEENIQIVCDDSKYTVDEILKILELDMEKHSYPASLSGGMKMRIALARAIYNNGDLFIMDEPFSALDDDLKSRILPKIFKLLDDKTIIIVSHNIEEAQKYAHNIINFNTIWNQ